MRLVFSRLPRWIGVICVTFREVHHGELCITVCTKATCGRDLEQGQSFKAVFFCVLEMRFEGQATVKVYAKEFVALHRLNDVITNFQGWIRTEAREKPESTPQKTVKDR